jgi:hypothetical protein
MGSQSTADIVYRRMRRGDDYECWRENGGDVVMFQDTGLGLDFSEEAEEKNDSW